MTDNLSQLSSQDVGPSTPPTAQQARRAGLLAADYALGQPDSAGALAEVLAALGLTAQAVRANRCQVCDEPLPPGVRLYRSRFCSRTCGGAGAARTRKANAATRRAADAQQ